LGKICSKEKLDGIPIYVFLNESDIFVEKFDLTAFSIGFPGFTGAFFCFFGKKNNIKLISVEF
jgi:hypothetical protein